MQVAHGAFVGVAAVGAADACGVGDHGLELLADQRFGVGHQDGVAVALGHFAAVGAWQLGRGGEQHLRRGKNVSKKRPHRPVVYLWIVLVEPPRHLAGQLYVRLLVLANRNILRLIEKNVGGHQERIAEESVGCQVFAGEVLLLFLVAGHTFQPAEGRNHPQQQRQLVMLLHPALHKDGASLRVESGSQEVQHHLKRVGRDLRCIGVVGCQRVQVGDEEVALVLVL